MITRPAQPYTIRSIVEDGCFVEPDRLTQMLEVLSRKHNLILQGAPGTGKTWLAKRLAYALVGTKPAPTVRSVQFHPNISYEDVVCGWRPGGTGKLERVEGPLMEAARCAHENPDIPVVLVIEEINRGNPAQIFGEMLTLMEGTKREPSDALRLAHLRSDEPAFWLPKNFFVIGTMNVADRSLAIVDFALRRRFAFVELEPCFNGCWFEHVTTQRGMPRNFGMAIQSGMAILNRMIEEDQNLGRGFRIGHSFFVPPSGPNRGRDWHAWFRAVLETEIRPLLEEYWYDSPEQVRQGLDTLRIGLEGV